MLFARASSLEHRPGLNNGPDKDPTRAESIHVRGEVLSLQRQTPNPARFYRFGQVGDLMG